MKNGLCPKCGSMDIRSGEFLEEKEGRYTGNRIPVLIALRNTAAWLDNYVCARCGYVESYIADPKKLAEIAEAGPPCQAPRPTRRRPSGPRRKHQRIDARFTFAASCAIMETKQGSTAGTTPPCPSATS